MKDNLVPFLSHEDGKAIKPEAEKMPLKMFLERYNSYDPRAPLS